jgi:uncharacterized membrane protein YgcG
MIGALTGSLALLLALGATPVLADDFGTHQAGQHVYDRAEVLPADGVADLESRAGALDRAGAPTVVYLRRKAADEAATRQDARDLMDAWHVESAAGARDGLVVLLNLKPADPHHGSVGLVAGSAHATDGRLTDDRLQAIFDGQMRPRLATGDIAGAIAGALSAIGAALEAPPPSAAAGSPADQQTGDDIGAPFGAVLQALTYRPAAWAPLARYVQGPLDALAIVLAAAAGGSLLIVWRRSRAPSGSPTLAVADEGMPAAVAGALAAGRLPEQGLSGTVLDLARKGALRIESTGDSLQPYQLRLLDAGPARETFEQVVMNGLAAQADGQGVVAGSTGLVIGMRLYFRAVLRTSLLHGGLLASNRARLPTAAVAVLALAAGTIVLILSIVALEPKSLAGAASLLGVGVLGLVVASSLRDTMPRGEQAAADWRRLRAGLRSAAPRTIRPEGMGSLLPLAVALNVPGAVNALVSAAAAADCWPEWFATTAPYGAHRLVAWRRLRVDLCSPTPLAGTRRRALSSVWTEKSRWSRSGGPSGFFDTGGSPSSDSPSSDSSSGGGSF